MDTLTTQLEQLESAQLLRRASEEDVSYLFKHALTQEAAYESLLMKRRRELHRVVAQAYERLYPEHLDKYAARLAEHYAEAGDDARAAAFATRAGDLAAHISAYTEARAQYTTALAALSRLPGTEQNRRARVDTTIKQINVAWGIDSAAQNLQRLFQAEVLAQTLAASDGTRLARVRYWIARLYSYCNEHRKAVRYYEQVLASAYESQDQELIALASSTGGRTFFLQGYFGKAVPLLEQAIPYLERTGDWQEWVLAKVCLAISLAGQGHFQEARRHGDEAVQRALLLNDLTSIASARGMAARVEFMAGNLQRLLDETREMVEPGKGANPLVDYMILGFQAWAEGRLGMHETARATMAAANEVASHVGTRLIYADWFAAARAEIELNAGRIEDALRLAQEAVDEAQETGGVFSGGIAERVWGQALATMNGPEDTQAEVHLEKSLKLFEEGEAVIEAARTRVAWGHVLQTRGQAAAARARLEKAAAQFEASGLANELEQTKSLIDSIAI